MNNFPQRDYADVSERSELVRQTSLAFFDADGGAPRIDKKEVTLGTWEPEERKY